MLELIRQISVLNRFFLISTAVSVAWLLSEAGKLDRITSFIGAWIPYFIAQWFGAYRKGLSESINRLGEYLLKIEAMYAAPELGWQRLIYEQTEHGIYPFARTRLIHQLVSISTLLFAFYYAVRYSLDLNIGAWL